METIREYVNRVAKTWRAVGAALAVLAGVGLVLPDWVSVLTSDATVNLIVEVAEAFILAIGAAIAAWNQLRSDLSKPGEQPEGEVTQLSASVKKRFRRAFGPVYVDQAA